MDARYSHVSKQNCEARNSSTVDSTGSYVLICDYCSVSQPKLKSTELSLTTGMSLTLLTVSNPHAVLESSIGATK
jgi:hypothetical protein